MFELRPLLPYYYLFLWYVRLLVSLGWGWPDVGAATLYMRGQSVLFPELVMGMEWDGGEVSVGGETI
jgi:hypothetical protein